MATKSESSLIQGSQEIKKEQYQLTAEEALQYGLIVDRIIKARNQRETPSDYFDGLTYEQAYLSNKRAAMSYLQPKKNDDEVRINTGTTEKRIELVLNELLALNLEEEIETFDKDDNPLVGVSDVFTDLVKRTEQIEHAKDKDITIYQELLTQPSVFVEEMWVKQIDHSDKKKLSDSYKCERRLLQGVQMYLGDISMPDTRFNEQPYLIKYARMSYSEAEYLFKDLDPVKWGHIVAGSYNALGSANSNLYRKGSLEQNEIEAFWYMSWPDNEIQILVNGIPFLKVGEKYTNIYGNFRGYHITMVSLKPYGGDSAYGKPLTQSAKTLQALDNETIRNLIRKFRQALEPPIGVVGKHMLSRDIWNPGSIVKGVKKDDFEKLIDHSGVTRSEMAMFDLIEKKTNEFIGTSQSEPLQNKTQVTATELTLAQKNAVKMLGLSVLSVMRLKERLALLRVRNLLIHYTEPVNKQIDPITGMMRDMYARFTLRDTELTGGRTGDKIIQLSDYSLNDEQKQGLFQQEEQLRKQGRNVEFKILNVDKLKNLELYFYANVVSKPKESSDLDKTLIQEKINQGVAISNITGRRMNADKLIKGFERAWREHDLFEKDVKQIAQEVGATSTGSGEKLNNLIRGGQMGSVPSAGEIM